MPLIPKRPARPRDDGQGLFRLEPGHVPAVVGQLVRAFADDPIWTAVFPEPGERARRSRPLFAFMLRLGIMKGEAWAPSERLEGAAVWLPERHADPGGLAALRCGALAIPFHVGLARLRRFGALGKAIARIRKEHAPAGYRYLAMLGIAPEHQRRGLGSTLLRPMLARSDRKGTPVWLTETEANVELYRKHGFKVAAEFEVSELALKMWAMLRPPMDPGR